MTGCQALAVVVTAAAVATTAGTEERRSGISGRPDRGGMAEGRSVVGAGGSGSGRAVRLKGIPGSRRADRGSIRGGGEEVVGLNGKARDAYLQRFGMLFQGGALFDSLSVWENVAFGLIQGRDMARAKAREFFAADRRVRLRA